ncbi:MAG: hypothetical protein ABFD90_00230 [Phycisphaerales bacterium]
MKIMLIDWDDGVRRWVSRIAIMGVPLALILEQSVLPAVVVGALLVMVLLMSLGVDRIRRQNNVADKPFSFCLPGFRESLRRRLFATAAIMGLALSIYPLVPCLLIRFRDPVPDTNPLGLVLSTVAAFLMGMVIALVMGAFRFVLSRLAWDLLMLLSIPLFLAAVAAFCVFVEYPLVGIPLCAGACVFVWFGLGDLRRVKRGHRILVDAALDRRAQVGVTKTASPWVEGLFRRPMEHRSRFQTGRYVWGSLYRAFGLVFSYWIWILVSIAGCALVLGYFGIWSATAAFGILAVSAVHRPVVFDGIWLPLGRKERRHATIAVAVAVWLLCIGAAGLVTICSWGFSLLLSGSAGAAYAGIDPKCIYLVCALVPWALAWRLFRLTHFRVADAIAWGTATIGTVVLGLLMLGRVTWPKPAEPILFLAGLIGGWAFFLLALREACMRASLIESQFDAEESE